MQPNELILPDQLDLLGIFAAAASGALTGIRKGLDLVGVLVLGAVTGLGGGVIRDLMIGVDPPAMLTDWRYLTTAALASLAVLAVEYRVVAGAGFVRSRVPLGTAYLIVDAATLGCFAVSGTTKALTHGLSLVPAALLGTITAVGGGVIRDVLTNEVPTVLRREIYALPALLGGLIVAVTARYDPHAWYIAFGAAAATAGLRLLAVRRDWHATLPAPAPVPPAPPRPAGGPGYPDPPGPVALAPYANSPDPK